MPFPHRLALAARCFRAGGLSDYYGTNNFPDGPRTLEAPRNASGRHHPRGGQLVFHQGMELDAIRSNSRGRSGRIFIYYLDSRHSGNRILDSRRILLATGAAFSRIVRSRAGTATGFANGFQHGYGRCQRSVQLVRSNVFKNALSFSCSLALSPRHRVCNYSLFELLLLLAVLR